MIGARSSLLLALVGICSFLAGTARADTNWERISPMFSSNIVVPTLANDGSNAVVAWARDANAATSRLEVVTFRPSLTDDAASLAGPVEALPPAGWSIGPTPQLFPKPGGGLQIAFDGSMNSAGFGLWVAPRNPDGSFGAPVQVGRPYTGLASAILLGDGTPSFATNHTGGAYVLRGANPDQAGVDFQSRLGNCCAYGPRIGLDGMGRLWLAWYSNASANTGLFLQQVDAATLAPVGSVQKAPGSESPYNNTLRIAFACSLVCRVAYGAGDSGNQRLVSWAPGEAAATTIAAVPAPEEAGRVVSASYRKDGRLWVGWYDGTNYRYTLGDEKGAGGAALSAGHPAGTVSGAFVLNSLAVDDNLLLATNWVAGTNADQHAIWVNVVTAAPADVLDTRFPEPPPEPAQPVGTLLVQISGNGTVSTVGQRVAQDRGPVRRSVAACMTSPATPR